MPIIFPNTKTTSIFHKSAHIMPSHQFVFLANSIGLYLISIASPVPKKLFLQNPLPPFPKTTSPQAFTSNRRI